MQEDAIDSLTAHWARVRPGLDADSMAAVTRIMLFGRYLERAEDNTLSRHGVSLWQFDVLATLRGAGPPHTLTAAQIMRTVMLSSGGMTNRLDRLEADGYVKRMPNPNDRRSVQIKLTPKGKKLIDEALTVRFEVARQALAPLTKAEMEKLNDFLRRLVGTTNHRR